MKVIHEFVGAAHVYRVVDLDDRYLLQVRGVDVLGAPTWAHENKGSFAWGLLAAELLKRGPAMWVWMGGAPKAPVVPTRLIVRPEDKAITVERHNETSDGWVPFTQYIHARTISSDAEMWAFVKSPLGEPRLTDEGRFNIYASALASDTHCETLPLPELWCNTCESGFRSEPSLPCCPMCGETLAIHELSKSKWTEHSERRRTEVGEAK